MPVVDNSVLTLEPAEPRLRFIGSTGNSFQKFQPSREISTDANKWMGDS
jgi:hypothetical protein